VARVRRTWSVMRAEIRRLLREEVEAASYWTNAQLLDLFNQSVDLRSVELMNTDEGWLRESTTITLSEATSSYAIPEGYVGRIPRVVLLYSTGDGVAEIPLVRDERIATGVYHPPAAGGAGWGWRPTVRLEGSNLIVEPRPASVTNLSIRLEVEAMGAQLTADGSKLPLSFPDIAETLLIYDAVNLALATEHAQTSLDNEYINGLLRFHADYEKAWKLYIDQRLSRPPVFGRRHYLGD
jgi:hypothetical protein